MEIPRSPDFERDSPDLLSSARARTAVRHSFSHRAALHDEARSVGGEPAAAPSVPKKRKTPPAAGAAQSLEGVEDA